MIYIALLPPYLSKYCCAQDCFFVYRRIKCVSTIFFFLIAPTLGGLGSLAKTTAPTLTSFAAPITTAAVTTATTGFSFGGPTAKATAPVAGFSLPNLSTAPPASVR